MSEKTRSILHELLLLLYPRRFRREYGHDAICQLERDLREAEKAAPIQWIFNLMVSLFDFALAGLLERVASVATLWRGWISQGPRNMTSTIVQDLRFAIRSFLKRPAFAGAAVMTLTLGVAANVAIFNLAMATLFPRLPVKDPDRLVSLFQYSIEQKYYSSLSLPAYRDYAEGLRAFTGIAAYADVALNLNRGNGSDRIDGQLVSRNYFTVLGVKPALGRGFVEGENEDESTVVLSYRMWQREFGESPDVIGTAITLNGQSFIVVGVAPHDFEGLDLGGTTQVWLPLSARAKALPQGSDDILMQRGNHSIEAVGRLAPSASFEQATSETQAFASGLARQYPELQGGWTARLMPANKAMIWPGNRGELSAVALMLSAVVALILLLACANVANMFLARIVARRAEIAVRLALGAARIRLVQQLAIEAVVLTFPALLLGGAAGSWLDGFARNWRFSRILPLDLDITLDPRVLVLLLVLAPILTFLVGLLPAYHASRSDIGTALKTSRAAHGKEATTIRNVLSVSQIAVSVAVLSCAGLLGRSAVKQLSLDLGFDPQNVLLASVNPAPGGYARPEGAEFHRLVLETLDASPAVSSVSAAWTVPFGRMRFGTDVWPEGATDSAHARRVTGNVVTPKYFETMKIPLLRGRDFSSQDVQESSSVIVNKTAALQFWPGQDALGKQLILGEPTAERTTVIGVVEDLNVGRTLFTTPRPSIFLPLDPEYSSGLTYHIRSAGGDMSEMTSSVRRAIAAVDPNVPAYAIKTLESQVRAGLSPALATAVSVYLLGALGLVLAAVGTYGVIAHAVATRAREIGIRIALGAASPRVLALVLRQGLLLLAIGVAVGVPAGLVLSRTLQDTLFGVSPNDLPAFLSAVIAVAVVTMVAVFLPARHATTVDPIVVLRDG